MRSAGSLPVNMKVIIEGEEEVVDSENDVEIKLEEEAIEDEPEEESIALDDFEARLQRLRERRLGDN